MENRMMSERIEFKFGAKFWGISTSGNILEAFE